MLTTPTTLQVQRGALLALLLAVSIVSALRRGVRLHSWIIWVTFACVTTSSIFMLWGSINDAPGALRVGTVTILWPILFIFIIGVYNNTLFWKPYLKVMVIASMVVEIMCFILLTDALGITNIGIINYVDAEIGIYQGMTQFHTANLTTLLFSIPYLLSKAIFLNEPKNDPLFWKYVERLTLLGGLILMFFAGRRIFWLVCVLAPIITVILIKLTGARIIIRNFLVLAVFCTIALITSCYIYNIDLNAIWNDFIAGFDFSSGIGAYRRKEQFQLLIEGWKTSPFFGLGHGAAAVDNTGLEQSWSYELFYIALLFQVGIVGMTIYTGSVIWLYLRSIKLIRHNINARLLMIPVLTGLTSFLFASGTNPYLAKFDYLWVLFLPIAFLNSYLIHNQSATILCRPRSAGA